MTVYGDRGTACRTAKCTRSRPADRLAWHLQVVQLRKAGVERRHSQIAHHLGKFVMPSINYEEIERRRTLSPDEQRAEIVILLAECRQARSPDLSLSGYGALESLVVLADFDWLTELDCSRTEVSDLAPLSGLGGLTELNCCYTAVSDLTPLSGLTGLTKLDCFGTPVSDLTPLSALTGLTELDCCYTAVSDLAPLSGLSGLTKLNCATTPVFDLAPLSALTGLTELDCSETEVADLMPLSNLIGLRKVWLFDTSVSDLTPLSGVVGLADLWCSHTLVSDLSPLSGLTGLKELSFSSTSVSDLSPLSGLTGLEELSFTSTSVSDLSPLSGLTGLKELSFTSTSVSDLSPLSGLTGLIRLYCAETQVSDLSPLSDLNLLSVLDCSLTSVSDLTPLSGLNELLRLDCSCTSVTDLRPLMGLAGLTHLDIGRLRLAEWPSGLLDAPALEFVSAEQARIGSVPPEELVADGGRNCLPNIQAYFADLAAGAVRLQRSKIIILGNGRVGKTQLRRWLLNSDALPMPFDRSIGSTHGIEVMRGPLALPDGGRIDASLWDFGGQDIYHGTHSLFMRTRALFILCWCPQQEDNREQLLDGLLHRNWPLPYWVDYVRQLASNENPIILVQTQCDTPAMRQSQRFAGLDVAGFESCRIVEFSAETGLGGATLREAIGEAVQWTEAHYGVPLIGAGRLKVLNQLEQWRSEDAMRPPAARQYKSLTQDEFSDLCALSGGVSAPDRLLNFLHHAGVVFHRPGLFDDRIILDQDWALSAIYAVFNRDHCYRMIKRAGGRFRREDVAEKVWQDYGLDEQRLFLSMMQSCGIIFTHDQRGRHDDDAEYIAPELLPQRDAVADRIESRWHGETIQEARLRFALLHDGLIRQIIARIGREARIFGDYWQTGVLFYERNRQSDAMIEANLDVDGWGGEIVISCRNGRASELLALMTDEVVKIASALGMVPTQKPELPKTIPTAPEEEDRPAEPLVLGDHPSIRGKWFVSYAWGDDTPEGKERDAKVEALCAAAAARGVVIIRDKSAMDNGDSIRRFMEGLAAGDRIIVILSAKYLASPYCMFELYHAWLKQQANADLFVRSVRVFRLPCARIGDPLARGALGRYWREKAANLEPFVNDLGAIDLADYRLMKHFALNVGDITHAINDRISPRGWDEFLEWAFAE